MNAAEKQALLKRLQALDELAYRSRELAERRLAHLELLEKNIPELLNQGYSHVQIERMFKRVCDAVKMAAVLEYTRPIGMRIPRLTPTVLSAILQYNDHAILNVIVGNIDYIKDNVFQDENRASLFLSHMVMEHAITRIDAYLDHGNPPDAKKVKLSSHDTASSAAEKYPELLRFTAPPDWKTSSSSQTHSVLEPIDLAPSPNARTNNLGNGKG